MFCALSLTTVVRSDGENDKSVATRLIIVFDIEREVWRRLEQFSTNFPLCSVGSKDECGQFTTRV